MLEAGDTNIALLAHCLGSGRFFFVVREKHRRIEPPTGTKFPPHDYFGRHNRPTIRHIYRV